MKILLAGEYSRLHNSLKEGLSQLGHTVKIISTGDGFKNYPSDYSVRPVWLDTAPGRWLRKAVHRLTDFDPAAWEKYYRLQKILPDLPSFDVVQLINPYPFETTPNAEKNILEKLFSRSEKSFLLACGDDYRVNSYYLEGKMRYSVLTPYLENPDLKKLYGYSLKYLTPPFRELQTFVENRVNAVIPTDLDYAIPYAGHPKNAGLIPNPVNTDKIRYTFPSTDEQIVIFHGINSGNYWKKGNRYFSEALQIIQKKYPRRVRIVETYDLPYDQYIRRLREAHIVLDQVYSFDQGYNALESMAMGKVVFTGSEKDFYDYYGLQDPVAVNALPDTNDLVEKLSYLIENPAELQAISHRARQFIEQHHHYVRIAEKYADVWEKS